MALEAIDMLQVHVSIGQHPGALSNSGVEVTGGEDSSFTPYEGTMDMGFKWHTS